MQLNLRHVMSWGKYKGMSIQQIIDIGEASYINWCISQRFIDLDAEAAEALLEALGE